jgi:hypothetical protein
LNVYKIIVDISSDFCIETDLIDYLSIIKVAHGKINKKYKRDILGEILKI